MVNKLGFFEIATDDVSRAQAFYGELFDWSFEVVPEMGGYAFIDGEGEGSQGGIAPREGEEPTHACFYIGVPDCQSILDRAVAGGGKVIRPVTVIPDMVTYAKFLDPEGNVVGIFQTSGGA